MEQKVIRRLRAAGGISVRERGDGDLVVSVKGGETVLHLEVRHRFTDTVINQMEELPPEEREHTVLVVPELSSRRRRELRLREISWVEYDAGVVHLRAPHLAIDLPEQPIFESDTRRSIPSLSGKAGIIVEALIELGQRHELVSQPEVAQLSGSTQAWTSRTFSALVEAEALEVVGRGPAKEWRPNIDALLRLWTADGGPSPDITGIHLWARTPEDLLRSVAQRLEEELIYAIGGVAAANLHEPTLTSLPQISIWAPLSQPPERVAATIGGELVDSGANLFLWQATGDPALRLAKELGHWRPEAPEALRHVSTVTPARAAVEALNGTGRGPEVGENLRRRIIKQAEDPHDE